MEMSLAAGVHQLSALLERVLDRERAVAELRQLDARGLADLGITRAQIRAYVAGALPLEAPRPAPCPARPTLRLIEGGARAVLPSRRPPLRLAASRS